MSRSAAIASVVLFTLAVAPAHAGAELVLKDGRTVSGTEVRRQGSNYHLTLADGQILTFPLELVRELRLEEQGSPGPPPAPTAMRSQGPEVLVGPPDPVEPPAIDDQLTVLGPPAEFRPSIFDPIWVPTSDWTLDPAQNDFNPARWFTAPIDPIWTPWSAFDARIDVFERSHSTWPSSPIDPVWWPTETTWLSPLPPTKDRASPEPSVEPIDEEEDVEIASAQFTPAGRPAAVEGRVDPQVCAREIFRPLTSRGDRSRQARISVTPVGDASLTDLQLDLFRGRLDLDGRSYAALFATEGETCRLIGGDLDPLLGVSLADAEKAEHALRAYERALDGKPTPALETSKQKIDYAFSLSLLADPGTSRGPSAVPALLDTRADLERFGGAASTGCSATAKRRTVEIEHALAEFAPPTVLAADGGDVVTLRTWSADGGTVTRHTVRLRGAGATSIERFVVASHVGDHQDQKARK